MRSVAAWLVARPLHGILALAATATPLLGILSSIVMVLLMLHHGAQRVVMQAMIAAGLLAVISVVMSVPLSAGLAIIVLYWLPAMLFGLLMRQTRSLTLALQLSVIIVIAGLIGFFGVVGDVDAYWERMISTGVEQLRAAGQVEQADNVQAVLGVAATQATNFVAIGLWSIYAGAFLGGYQLYRRLPTETVQCGLFRDLNFGRVIAATMAVASIVAFAVNVAWLESAAFVLFAVFWLQGLAIAHWMYQARIMPVFGVIVIYGLLIVVTPVMIVALAVLGYIDAWFRLRRMQLPT